MGRFNIFKKVPQKSTGPVPRHIAIIMDGNGRWAEKRGLIRSAGHAAGSETFRRIATYCRKIGVSYLTVYAFSTENWKRPVKEVEAILNLFRKYLREAVDTMAKEQVALRVVGDLTPLPEDIKELIRQTDAIADTINGVQATLLINYGGRDEIKNAVRHLARQVKEGRLFPEEIEEETVAKALYTANMPDPDLIIRPSGELRISNFLLWQSAYAEYYFTDVLWPDFTESELDRAVASYNARSRRFGGI